MTEISKTAARSGKVAGFSLFAVILADGLFYREPLGWTLGLYALLILAGLIWADQEDRLKSRHGIALSIAAAGLILSLILHPGVTGVIMTLLALISIGIVSRSGWVAGAWDWVDRWLQFAAAGWRCMFRDLRSLCLARPAHAARWKSIARAVLRFSPILLLAIVFIGLFAQANPVISIGIERIVNGLRTLLGQIELPEPSRVVLWAVVLMSVWALLRFQPSGLWLKWPDAAPALVQAEAFFLTPRTIASGLAVFNLLFALQNLLDIGYLWGGATLPEGMTYAEYAHRGAYPLVATALLAAAFVLVTFRQASDSSHSCLTRCLVYLWIAQNVFLTASAAWRMNLYVEVYSLTKLRVAAAIWMLLVALGLVWICARIMMRRSNGWLVNINVVTLFGVLYLCAFANISGFIARYNVRHCHEISGRGSHLDFSYLRTLGPAAIPALRWIQAQAPDDPELTERIDRALHHQQDRLEHDMCNWRGWTWRWQRLMHHQGRE